jgi:predicted MFS family arabinose efflux permease
VAYDPYVSAERARQLGVELEPDLGRLVETADFITIHLPKTPETLYAFSAVLGLTWLATVPMTAGIVGKLFGVRYLATLFGLTLFSHQVGAFFGAWLGGIALDRTGSYDWMWYADAALAFAAALVNLPIRDAAPVAKPA